MLKFTCGSTQPLDLTLFDGVVLGYHYHLFDTEGNPDPMNYPGKIIRSQFLYGNKHKKPHPLAKCDTIEEWVRIRIGKLPKVNEWILVNEFTDDLGTPYPLYGLDDLKRYCQAAIETNPNTTLIIGDFKPYLIKKWEKIAGICDALKAEGFPIEIGIQTHLKSHNAPVFLAQIPTIAQFFDVPLHLLEVSLWYTSVDRLICQGLWDELIQIGNNDNFKSYCPWWLTIEDADAVRRMPTFERLSLFVPS